MQLRVSAELVREAVGAGRGAAGEQGRALGGNAGEVNDQEREADRQAEERGLLLDDGR
jgi:hypothetical protein